MGTCGLLRIGLTGLSPVLGRREGGQGQEAGHQQVPVHVERGPGLKQTGS